MSTHSGHFGFIATLIVRFGILKPSNAVVEASVPIAWTLMQFTVRTQERRFHGKACKLAGEEQHVREA
jgi:hypothetical protein